MVERDNISNVSDGDQLNEGYFNDTVSFLLVQDIVQNLNNLKQDMTTNRVRTPDINFIDELGIDRTDIDDGNTDASLIDVGNVSSGSKQSFWGAMTIYDDMNDDSFNTTNWGTGGNPTISTSESGGGTGNNEVSFGRATQNATTGSIRIWAKAKNFKAGAKDATIYIKVYSTVGTVKLRMYDIAGTSSIELANSAGNTLHRIEIDFSAGTCDIYTNEADTPVAVDVDISSLAEWCVGVRSDHGPASPNVGAYYMRYIDTITTQDIVVDSVTADDTVDTMIIHTTKDVTDGSVVLKLSANNGSNYDTVTEDLIDNIANTGTQPKAKIEITSTATQTAKIKEFGVLYE